MLPNGKRPEKWGGLAIRPRLKNGARLILTGRDVDQPTMFKGQLVGPVPPGHVLLPGVLHAYAASASDLAGYI